MVDDDDDDDDDDDRLIPEKTSWKHLAAWERARWQDSVTVPSSLTILPSSLPSD